MPTQVSIDRIDNLSITERLGVIRGMVRRALVEFDVDGTYTDFSVCQAALAALDSQGITAFSVPAGPEFAALVLVDREAKVMEDPGWVSVDLKYEHILDGPNQVLFAPANGLLFGKGRSSITQKKTNFFYPKGDRTQPRIQILVAHSYPKTDQRPSVLRVLDPVNLPYTIKQGGEIDLPFPQGNFKLYGVINTDNPWSIKKMFINCINDDVWLDEPAFTWICSEVEWDVLNPQVGSYRFGFEFQNNTDTWLPTVAFNDQETNKPPADLEAATAFDPNIAALVQNQVANPTTGVLQPAGYWNVPALLPVNFNTLFAAFFEGFNPPGVN